MGGAMVDLPEPDIVTCDTRWIVALSQEFTMATRDQIPTLWHAFMNREFAVSDKVPGAVYGVSHGWTADTFSYGVGFETTSPEAAIPKGAIVIELVKGQYAVFQKRGPISGFPEAFDAIFADWLPGSAWRLVAGPVLERYPEDPDATEDARLYEIWLPVEAKDG